MTKLDNTRLTVIFLSFVLFFSIIIFNLYILQIKQALFFSHLAHQQYNVTKTAQPARAEIFDRNGKALALNKDTYAAFIIPRKLEQPEEVKKFLALYFHEAHKRLLKQPNAHFLYIKRRLTEQEKEIINKSGLADINLLSEPGRFYAASNMGPVIGLTDIDNNGIAGLELQYNNILAGKPSTYILEKDARSGLFYFKKETKVSGSQGNSLTLTIDSVLQFLVYEELKEHVINLQAEEGSVLIMNPENGEIITMAQYPDFDPNNISSNTSLNYTKNKLISDCYELGSVMKTFLALAGFEEKVVSVDEPIDCLGVTTAYINSVKVGTWKAHGIIPFSEVIAHSNNIGCVKIGQKLGTLLYDHYRKLGFGQKTTLNFPGEATGYITPPEKWSKSTLFTLTYGYALNANLVQLARAFSVIVNGGYLVQPKLILNQKIMKDSVPRYSVEALKKIREILGKTITEGTAKKAHIAGYTIIGKTGTANLAHKGGYDLKRNIFTFTGALEHNNYKRVIITCIKGRGAHHIHASTIAAPLFEAVCNKMLIHDKIIN